MKRALSPGLAVAFRKAADYCAAQEHCISEIRLKLRQWNIESAHFEPIILRLLKEGYIDEKRYASAFCRGKFRNLQWGRIKIRAELKKKQIAENLIFSALKEIEETAYWNCLKQLSDNKLKSISGDPVQKMFKTYRYLISKGFEPDLVREMLSFNLEKDS